jgi:glyoxylase-like metal-dependent hydrolase (beta-lactamase superfamily II)/8-oxo-dGTP pyrophosphatase MutT (NUDIX family)
VLLVRGHPRLEVYWVERSLGLAYLGGFHAFPGGRVSREDAAVPVLEAPSPAEAIGRAAAARELFEEVGVLLVRPHGGSDLRPSTDERLQFRIAVQDGKIPFDAFLRERHYAVDGALLEPAGRWLSPDFTPRGFDTRFYIAVCPAGEEPSVVAGELSRGEWVDPDEAHARWRAGEILLASPVRRGLEVLATCAREWNAAHAADPPGEALQTALRARLRDWASRLMEPAEARGGPIERVEMTPGAVLVPLPSATIPPATHTNCLVFGSGDCLLIDPGGDTPAAHVELARVLEGLAAEGRRIVAISATHGHGDHIAGIDEWRSRLKVPLLAHPLLANAVGANRVLVDGETIRLDGPAPWEIEVHFAPGHTRDSVVFFERRHGVLAAGDLLSGLSTTVIDPPDGELGPYLDSLRRLAGWPIRAIFPGHGPPTAGARERLVALIEHRRWREGRVVEALRSGAGTIETMLPLVYADTPETQWPWARRSLLAHLLYLEEQGRVRRQPDADGSPDAVTSTEWQVT